MKLFRLLALGISFSLLLVCTSVDTSWAAKPEILKISPTFSYNNTDFDFVMRIIGSGFVEGSTVTIDYPTEGIIAPVIRSVSFISSNELRAEAQVQLTTPEGFYNVTVATPDGYSSAIAENILELKKKTSTNSFYPQNISVSPPSVPEGKVRNLTIMGEQFAGINPLVRLIRTEGSEWYDINAVRLNHTEIHATVPDSVVVGTYDVLVRGTGGYGGNQFITTAALVVEPTPEPEPAPAPEPEPEPEIQPSPSPGDSSLPALDGGEKPSTHSSSVTIPQPKAAPAYFPNPDLFDYRASFIGQSGTVATGNDGILTHVMSAAKGSDILMWIKFTNTSSRQWWYAETLDPDDIHEVRLGLTKDASSPFAHSDWISINRLAKIGQNIQPGETATLQFRLHVPENLAPGAYKLSVGLVAEWVRWMYDDVHWEIQVN